MEENYQKSSVATHGSKFAVVNARRLTGLQQSVQNKFAWNVIQQVIRASGFELSKNSTVKVDEESRFLAVLKICCKWNYVSSIKNLPDHIVGTVECTSQIKDNYFNNSKEANRYFSDRLNTFSDNKDYIKASKEDEVLIQLHTFSKHADEELEKYYRYHTTPSDLFNSLLTLSKTHLTHPFSTLHTLLTTTTCPTPEYSNPSTSLTLTTIINCMNSTHATYLLHNFSTLSDIETLFTLPYKIDFQKHEFNEKLKDILALALFNFQLTYMRGQDEQHASLIGALKDMEVELHKDLKKMPTDYEGQRGQVKQLLLVLKDLYQDHVANESLKQFVDTVFGQFMSDQVCTIDFSQSYHKLKGLVKT